MQIIETNLPTNGSFKRRNSTDEIILHHAEASRASVEEVNRWRLRRDADRIRHVLQPLTSAGGVTQTDRRWRSIIKPSPAFLFGRTVHG